MFTFIVRRILIAIPLLWGVVTLVFLGFHLLVPGDPVDIILFGQGTAADRIRLRHDLGLDKPLIVQYWDFIKGAAHFDFGNSIQTHQPVMHEIALRFPTTLKLAVSALVLATLIGVTLGILSAVLNRKMLGTSLTALAVLGFSIPEFVLATLASLLFGLKLGLLPIAGQGGVTYFILPAVSLAVGLGASLARLIRTTMLDVLDQDFVRTAKAKGVRRPVILVKHVLRNALIPVITVYGLSMAALLGGALIVENIFGLQGLGTLFLQGISNHDYPLVEGSTFFSAVLLVTANLVVDIAYGFIDPRIHYS
ncbi:MAG: ABC transporter permease [Chloroflexota bacterium]